ncbi:MAG: hypothetical protein WAV09_01615 [Minisyncoccia bacterium]
MNEIQRERKKIYMQKYHKERRKKSPHYQRDYLRKMRDSVVTALGSKCVRCSFSDKRALQIDHINGGGSNERKTRGFSHSFHKHVLVSFINNEKKYQLLCANCNWIKRYENNEAKGRGVKTD